MHNFCSRLTMATNYLTLLPLRSVVHVLSPWIFVDTAFWPVEYEEVTVPDSEPKNSKTGHFHFVSWNTFSEGNNYCIRNLSSSRPLPSYNEAHTTMWKEKFSACSQFSHYHYLGSGYMYEEAMLASSLQIIPALAIW